MLMPIAVSCKVLWITLEDKIIGGNYPPPPPLNPWVTARFFPLNLPMNVHDLPGKYLKLFTKYNGEPTLSVE
jgi:hypothetical protein